MSSNPWSRDVDPFGALRRLQDDLSQTFFRPLGWDLGPSGRGVHPPVNVFQDERGYVIHVEVPGYKTSELSLEARGQTLRISGKRAEAPPAEGSFHRRERRVGEFSRALQLPRDLDPSRAEASAQNGILTVRVPLREESRPRRIDVRAS